MFEQYIGINARQHKMSSSVQPRARILVRCCGPRDIKGVWRPHHDPSSTACHRGRYSGVYITSLAMVEVATAGGGGDGGDGGPGGGTSPENLATPACCFSTLSIAAYPVVASIMSRPRQMPPARSAFGVAFVQVWPG